MCSSILQGEWDIFVSLTDFFVFLAIVASQPIKQKEKRTVIEPVDFMYILYVCVCVCVCVCCALANYTE